ncbi:MAG: NUDIX domain-containing protein [Chloroflexota bacterium]
MQPLSVNHPTEVVHGERVARQGKLRFGCSAVLFNPIKDKVLLTRRADNGQWCLPGGMFDPGESVAEGCEREVFEETGLMVQVIRLIGIYSNPNLLTVYPDGNKIHAIVFGFEIKQINGELRLSDETTDARFFPVAEAVEMDLFHGHAEHLRDALAVQDKAFIR